MTISNKRMISAVLAVCIVCAMLCACSGTPEASMAPSQETEPSVQEFHTDCTWEAFEAMSAQEQMEFQNSFPSIEAFDAWLQSVQPAQAPMPWDDGGKQPDEYTMEEFDALTAEQQMAFQNSFEDPDGFDEWLERAESEALALPWENGGKQPEDYTWEEFEALSMELQIAFQESFGGIGAFDAWMQKATYEELPDFSEGDGKALADHTWEEFENMTAEEQIRFQNSFESFEAFDQWLQNAQTAAGIMP